MTAFLHHEYLNDVTTTVNRPLHTFPIIVVRSPPFRSGFWASPTRDGSLLAFSFVNVLHSEPTSITRSPDEDRKRIQYSTLGLHPYIHLVHSCKPKCEGSSTRLTAVGKPLRSSCKSTHFQHTESFYQF